jgi:flagellin-specific chaperone FliS
MTNQWLEAIAPEMIDVLFQDLLVEASEEEHVSILFNALQNFLTLAWGGGAAGKAEAQRDGVVGAVAIVCFLRDHLKKGKRSPANGVLRRFYNAAHRQIINAHRDGTWEHFHEVKSQIAKVVQRPYSRSFFMNCTSETNIGKAELVRFLLSSEVRGGLFSLDASVRVLANTPPSVA